MTRTVPFSRGEVFSPAKGTVDLFNVLDFEPPASPSINGKEKEVMAGINHTGSNPPEDLTGRDLMDFYRDSVLLITGGTGFIGGILLQKLLRTFPIKRIYLLVRKKNTQSVEERMDEFFQNIVRFYKGLEF